MGVDGDLYNVVLVLHILAAIIGFGGMFIAGFYGIESRRLPGGEGLAVAQATLKVSGQVPTVAVAAVPDPRHPADPDERRRVEVQPGLDLALVPPVHRPHGAGDGAPGPHDPQDGGPAGRRGGNATEVEAMGKRAAAIGAVVNVLWVITLALMVFKPGYP